jgi:hypothetical protein
MIHRHAAEGLAGTGAGDGALVAVEAAIMADLQEKRAVAEAVAALDTFGATDAKLFVNTILIIRVFDVGALDGGGRAKLVFRRRGQLVWFRREKSGAKLAVAAHRVGVDAFDGRLFQHAVGGAVAAVQAFGGIDLPHPGRAGAACGQRAAATPRPVMVISRAPLRKNCRRVNGFGGLAPLRLPFHHPHVAGDDVQDVDASVRIHRGIDSAVDAIVQVVQAWAFSGNDSAPATTDSNSPAAL